MAMKIQYQNVGKTFGHVTVLTDFDVEVPDGKFLALLGPSGCGKTTALRIMSGLEQPTSGRVFLGERDVTEVPPRGRDIAMVFQSYALYPQFKVADNIAYPLRIRKVPKEQRTAEVARVAELMSLTPLLDRKPRQLSGGERQRVALARAIIRKPAAFLMDEPLSNLDAQLRIQMRTEIKRLQKELAVTTLYVTHDQVEAMTMADQVAIMYKGKLQQHATPAKLYAQPANTFVAKFVGSPPMNILPGSVTEGIFRCPDAQIPVGPTAPAGDAQIGFRPEAAAIVAASEPGAMPARVYTVEPLGNEVIVSFLIGNTIVHVRAPADSQFAMGDSCGLKFDLRYVHLFDPADGQRIDWVA
jgi:multiple sugar transport system ATP-binding protein